jgi:putative tricarboxylic transport membrane protein
MDLFGVAQLIFTPSTLLLMALGVSAGLVVGAIPGLNATMALALITPLTFSMNSNVAFSLLCAVYVGAISGGLYSAILINIPGTSSSIATTFDGFPLARKGKAGLAIGTGIISSFIGGTFSFVCLMTIAPLLAKVALKFGPFEYFAVSLLGLSTIASVVSQSTVKSLLSCVFGLLLSVVGLDRVVGVHRFTFGSLNLSSGFDALVIMIGVFAVPQILSDILEPDRTATSNYLNQKIRLPFGEIKSYLTKKISIINMIRSSLIGTWIGILPGAGGSIASLLAYDQARRASKEPKEFGKGDIQGIIGSETANNAVIGGSIIPLLTLGIPGDTPAAVMLAALTIHGLQPGPLLFTTNPDSIYSILISLYTSNIFTIIISLTCASQIIKILKAPKNMLLPLIITMCVVGSYAINQRFFDVWVMIVLGIIGYIMQQHGYPAGPMVLGVILGPLVETNLRQAIQVSNNGIWEFFTRPISGVTLLLVFISFLVPVIRSLLNKQKSKNSTQPSADGGSEQEEPDRYLMRVNQITGIVLIILAIVIFKLSDGIVQTSMEAAAYGPAFYPKLLAICLAVLSAILVIFPTQKGDKKIIGIDMKKYLIAAIILIAYPAMISTIGFVTGTIVFLTVSFLSLGELNYKRIPKYLILSSIVSLSVYFIFEKAFYVFLPHGFLF